MKWSVEVSGWRFTVTQLKALPLLAHAYYIVLAVIFGFAWGGTTLAGWLIRAFVFYALVWLLFLFICWRRHARMVRLTGTRETQYELTEDAVLVQVGKDKVTLPRDQLTFKKAGEGYVVLKRRGSRLGTLVLQFDDSDTQKKVQTALDRSDGQAAT